MPPAIAGPSTSMTEDSDPKTAKRDLRRAMRMRRDEAHAKNPGAALALCNLFFETVRLPTDTVIAGYAARNSEIDPYPLLETLYQRGHRLCLPIVGGTNEPLKFRAYTPGDVLIPTGTPPISEPATTAIAVEPDIVLVPLLAFDLRGNRLGQGAGHYDRTLTALRNHRKILAIGVGFDCQKVAEVPAGPLDAVLDKVITETQAYSLLKSS